MAMGAAAADTCSDWTSSASQVKAEFGDSALADSQWTASATLHCNNNLAHLYCFEQQ